MPLLYENANSVAMIKHAMTITKEATEHQNPGQIPVIAMDQPLFSLAKQIQTKTIDDKCIVICKYLHSTSSIYLSVLSHAFCQ